MRLRLALAQARLSHCAAAWGLNNKGRSASESDLTHAMDCRGRMGAGALAGLRHFGRRGQFARQLRYFAGAAGSGAGGPDRVPGLDRIGRRLAGSGVCAGRPPVCPGAAGAGPARRLVRCADPAPECQVLPGLWRPGPGCAGGRAGPQIRPAAGGGALAEAGVPAGQRQ